MKWWVEIQQRKSRTDWCSPRRPTLTQGEKKTGLTFTAVLSILKWTAPIRRDAWEYGRKTRRVPSLYRPLVWRACGSTAFQFPNTLWMFEFLSTDSIWDFTASGIRHLNGTSGLPIWRLLPGRLIAFLLLLLWF